MKVRFIGDDGIHREGGVVELSSDQAHARVLTEIDGEWIINTKRIDEILTTDTP